MKVTNSQNKLSRKNKNKKPNGDGWSTRETLPLLSESSRSNVRMWRNIVSTHSMVDLWIRTVVLVVFVVHHLPRATVHQWRLWAILGAWLQNQNSESTTSGNFEGNFGFISRKIIICGIYFSITAQHETKYPFLPLQRDYKTKETDWTNNREERKKKKTGLTTAAPGINILFNSQEWEECDQSCQTWQPQWLPLRQSARCDLMGFSHLLDSELKP